MDIANFMATNWNDCDNLKINPLYYIVQGYRESYLGGAWFWEHWQYSLYFWGVTIVLLLIGSTVFRRLKPHFSDVL